MCSTTRALMAAATSSVIFPCATPPWLVRMMTGTPCFASWAIASSASGMSRVSTASGEFTKPLSE